MTIVAAGRRFTRTDLPEHAVETIDDISPGATQDMRFRIGAPSAPYRLDATSSGLQTERSLIASWQDSMTHPITPSLAHLGDAMLLGQDCVVTRDGNMIAESTAHGGKPSAGDTLALEADGIVARQPIAIETTIDAPILYLGFVARQFGHFLVDFTSRLWALPWAKRHGLRVAVYADKRPKWSGFQRDFAAAADLKNVLFLTGPAHLTSAFLPCPLYPIHRGIHPDFTSLCAMLRDRIAAPVSPAGSDRVYLSRRLWGKRRILVNEAEIEALFARYDFAIVYPETLSVAEQLAVIRDTRHLASPIGSQTLLALYQVAPETVTILTPPAFAVQEDAIIARSRGADIHYILGEGVPDPVGRERFQAFHVDLRLVEGRLHALFGAPG